MKVSFDTPAYPQIHTDFVRDPNDLTRGTAVIVTKHSGMTLLDKIALNVTPILFDRLIETETELKDVAKGTDFGQKKMESIARAAYNYAMIMMRVRADVMAPTE